MGTIEKWSGIADDADRLFGNEWDFIPGSKTVVYDGKVYEVGDYIPLPHYGLQPGALIDQISPGDTVRALSWKQPYAGLMLHGKVETRTWDAKYRGLVLICASKTPYQLGTVKMISGVQYRNIEQAYADNRALIKQTNYCGKAIAIGELVGSVPMRPQDEAKCFVEYRYGLYAHYYANVMPIEPFEWKGQQGWSTLSAEVINQIEIL